MSSLKTAVQIFKHMMEKGQLDRESDGALFLEYRDPEVRAVLADLEETLEFKLVEATATVYFVPDSGNDLLGYMTKDLREWVAGDARLQDAFLQSYICMVILYMFYGGKNRNPKQREFLRIATLIEELDRRFALALASREETLALEEKVSLNFIRIAELWSDKRTFEEKSRKTKTGTVQTACRLLELEGLIRQVEEGREIRTTRKLDDLMFHYYLNDGRLEEIHDLLSKDVGPDA